MRDLVFLKLGGSLITDKNRPGTHQPDILARLAQEIGRARLDNPQMRLIIGHGSGSFGHTAAKKHNTGQGVTSAEGWLGFAEVWREARALNQIVLDALLAAGLPVIAFPPSSAVIAQDRKGIQWEPTPLLLALDAGLVPLVNGDVVFDTVRGGTILSTERIFIHLSRLLYPERILLAGIDDGVCADFPDCTQLIGSITPETFSRFSARIGGSASLDVTGGMFEKVKGMLDLLQDLPEMRSYIFSGLHPNNVYAALCGEAKGTCICSESEIF